MNTTRTLSRKLAALLFAAVLCGTLAGCGDSPMAPVRPDSITSAFSTNTEGWSAVGDFTGLRQDTVLKPGTPSGSFLRARDKANGETWYFRAPARYRGNQEGFYGGVLRFSVRVGMGVNALGGFSDGERFHDSDIVLRGGGLSLHYAYPPDIKPTSQKWTRINVTLSEGQGWMVVGERSRRRATEEQIRQVLANVVDLQIRGEYFVGVDWGAIDNVILQPAR